MQVGAEKIRVYLSITQYKMAEPALREARLPLTHRLFLSKAELEEFLTALRVVKLDSNMPLGRYRTWDALYDKIAAALKKAKEHKQDA